MSPNRMKFHESCNVNQADLFLSQPCKIECDCSDDQCDKVFKKIECPPNCSENCKNQHFGRQNHLPEIEVKESEVSGMGLYASQDIEEGTFIVPYIGVVISTDERQLRRPLYKNQGYVNYFFESTNTFTIDPTLYGNEAKFANHCCTPNMVAELWKMHNAPKNFKAISFKAIKNIKKGEELCFNYGEEYSDDMECFCGSTRCAGIVGKIWTPPTAKKSEKKVKDVPAPEVTQKTATNSNKRTLSQPSRPTVKKRKESQPERRQPRRLCSSRDEEPVALRTRSHE